MSIEGLEILMERAGFKILNIETPGKLDLDIVENMLKEDNNINLSNFMKYLINNRDSKTKKDFQKFLQRNKNEFACKSSRPKKRNK